VGGRTRSATNRICSVTDGLRGSARQRTARRQSDDTASQHDPGIDCPTPLASSRRPGEADCRVRRRLADNRGDRRRNESPGPGAADDASDAMSRRHRAALGVRLRLQNCNRVARVRNPPAPTGHGRSPRPRAQIPTRAPMKNCWTRDGRGGGRGGHGPFGPLNRSAQAGGVRKPGRFWTCSLARPGWRAGGGPRGGAAHSQSLAQPGDVARDAVRGRG